MSEGSYVFRTHKDGGEELVAGPYATIQEAQEKIWRAAEAACRVDPRAIFDKFGVVTLERSPLPVPDSNVMLGWEPAAPVWGHA